MLGEIPRPKFLPPKDSGATPPEKVLSEAIREISGLYLSEQMGAMLGILHPLEERNEVWERKAQEYPEFGEQIRGLRQAMNNAEAVKDHYKPVPSVLHITVAGFREVKDEPVQMFLKDVLFSRLTVEQNRLDLDAVGETGSMLSEMGLPQDFKSQQIRSITLEKAVGAVLQGKLRVTPTPHPQGK
jgi:hypothetical protein